MIQVLTDLFSTCLHHQLVPKAWKNALIILIHKKRNKLDIKITEQSACFPLCTRCFQTFFYKGEFIRCTSTNRVSKPDLGQVIQKHVERGSSLVRETPWLMMMMMNPHREGFLLREKETPWLMMMIPRREGFLLSERETPWLMMMILP